jgi:hypothetical protein
MSYVVNTSTDTFSRAQDRPGGVASSICQQHPAARPRATFDQSSFRSTCCGVRRFGAEPSGVPQAGGFPGAFR